MVGLGFKTQNKKLYQGKDTKQDFYLATDVRILIIGIGPTHSFEMFMNSLPEHETGVDLSCPGVTGLNLVRRQLAALQSLELLPGGRRTRPNVNWLVGRPTLLNWWQEGPDPTSLQTSDRLLQTSTSQFIQLLQTSTSQFIQYTALACKGTTLSQPTGCRYCRVCKGCLTLTDVTKT